MTPGNTVPGHARCLASRMALAVALALPALTGCMPAWRDAPALSQVVPPSTWRETVPAAATLETQWWLQFGDSVLSTLVEAALRRNTDVLVAAARVDEARALVAQADALRWPALDATVGAQAQHTLGTTGMTTLRSVQPELQLSWEIDLWGRLRQQTEAAGLRYQATQVEHDAVALGVAATTVQTYIGLLALDAQLQVAQATVASRTAALQLAAEQARVGYTSQLQLTQAQSELQAVEQTVPQLELAIRRQENALHLLAGELPGEITRGQGFGALVLPPVPNVLPSALLERRPDIVQRALLLAASDANLAARRAAFLPQVAISASVGRLFINALNYDPVSVWSVGGSILAPLFSAGRLTAGYDAASAQRDQAAYAYRGVVLNAFSEVENALLGVTRIHAQLDHAQKRSAILMRSLSFARDRYQAGYASYLEELDAQRNLYQVELDVIRLKQAEFENYIALCRALGGGWQRARV